MGSGYGNPIWNFAMNRWLESGAPSGSGSAPTLAGTLRRRRSLSKESLGILSKNGSRGRRRDHAAPHKIEPVKTFLIQRYNGRFGEVPGKSMRIGAAVFFPILGDAIVVRLVASLNPVHFKGPNVTLQQCEFDPFGEFEHIPRLQGRKTPARIATWSQLPEAKIIS
jgi:hypothetical protein